MPLAGLVVIVLSVGLILVSLVCFVGPRRVFYVSAVISVLLGSLVSVNSGSYESGVLWMTLALCGLTFLLSLVSARAKSGVSEQSHPMNLPVFG